MRCNLRRNATFRRVACRNLPQLDDNLKALDVQLSAEDVAHLNENTKPALGFPANMQPMFPSIHNGGTSVNGVYAEPSAFVLLRGEKPY
jgi:hypothetical protein